MPKLDLKRLPADAGSKVESSERAPDGGCENAEACGRSGGSGGKGKDDGEGGADAGGAGGKAGKGGQDGGGAGGKGGSDGSTTDVDAGRDAGAENIAGAGGGSMDAGLDAGAGRGGAGGSAGQNGATYCSTWRTQNSDGGFDDLGDNPGVEMNASGTVLQYICRTVPTGRSELALGKGVPPYGCYGTYENNGARVGYGKPNDFEVLLPNTTDCQVTWQAVTSGITPFDLGTPAQPGLYACRGRLENEPSMGGGTVSGRELGQWVEVGSGSERQCWTQFHNSPAGLDTGSKQVVDQLEVLVRAP